MCGGKAVKRLYDKQVKGYVYAISGGPGHKMQLPKDERKGLALKQPYLVFQFFVPAGQHISFEVGAYTRPLCAHHIVTQRKRFVRDRGCIQGLFRGC